MRIINLFFFACAGLELLHRAWPYMLPTLTTLLNRATKIAYEVNLVIRGCLQSFISWFTAIVPSRDSLELAVSNLHVSVTTMSLDFLYEHRLHLFVICFAFSQLFQNRKRISAHCYHCWEYVVFRLSCPKPSITTHAVEGLADVRLVDGSDGKYYEVKGVNTTLKVPLSAFEGAILTFLNQHSNGTPTGVNHEMAVSTSIKTMCHSFANGQLLIVQDSGTATESIIGTVFRMGDFLLTAKHVADEVVPLVSEKAISLRRFHEFNGATQSITYQLPPTTELVFHQKDRCEGDFEYDVAAFKPPKGFFASSGIPEMTYAPPASGATVTVDGLDDVSNVVRYTGIVIGPSDPNIGYLGFYHNASTRPSFSGAPILNRNRRVVGIHTGAVTQAKQNFGHLLEPALEMLGILKSPSAKMPISPEYERKEFLANRVTLDDVPYHKCRRTRFHCPTGDDMDYSLHVADRQWALRQVKILESQMDYDPDDCGEDDARRRAHNSKLQDKCDKLLGVSYESGGNGDLQVTKQILMPTKRLQLNIDESLLILEEQPPLNSNSIFSIAGRSGLQSSPTKPIKPSEDFIKAKACGHITGYDVPPLGAAAERISLFLQTDGKLMNGETPSKEEQQNALNGMLEEYPRTTLRALLSSDDFDIYDPATRALAYDEIERAMQEVKPTSSPGFPHAKTFGTTNADVFKDSATRAHIKELVLERLGALYDAGQHMDTLSSFTATDFVKMGYCDPVKVFVKQELHSIKKLAEGRVRLIWMVSLVDQIIERILYATQNKTEITMYHAIPSKPGMGTTGVHTMNLMAYAKSLQRRLETAPVENKSLSDTDVSGWDMSIPEWLMDLDREGRRLLCGATTTSAWNRISLARNACIKLSLLIDSDHHLYAQLIPGLQKSGTYNTSSSNSRMRYLQAFIVFARLNKTNAGFGIMCMGDDALEPHHPGLQSTYSAFGIKVKEARQVTGTNFEFCSHAYELRNGSEPVASPINLEKIMGNLLMGPASSQLERYASFINTTRNLDRNLPSVNKYFEMVSEYTKHWNFSNHVVCDLMDVEPDTWYGQGDIAYECKYL